MQTYKNQSFMSRLGFALAGVRHAVRTERSLRIQLFVLLCLLMVLVCTHPAPLWWALVILAASAVLAAELFNTAVERLADHLHPESHPEIRLVKDCAAGGVLIASLGALGVAIALLMALIWDSR
jgi:undecaprenol kinase